MQRIMLAASRRLARPALASSSSRVARPLSTSPSAPTPPKPAADAASTQQAAASSETPPQAPQIDSTMLFRLTNPEVNLDPNKRASWIVTGAVAVGCGLMLCFGLYQDRVTAAAKASAPPDPGAVPTDAVKRLPDGRLLMKDGSIKKA